MSGQVPPSSRAGKPRATRSERGRAADLVERFKGHDAEVLARVTIPDTPSTLAVIGELDGVLYTTQRDGQIEKYVHRFERVADKPLLCVSPDGLTLYIVGGRYVFTDRGIVDGSDSKNLPSGMSFD